MSGLRHIKLIKMTEKEIFIQLKSLKSITLSKEMKDNNREVLLSQISNTFVKTENPVKSFSNIKNVFSFIYKPALTVAGIFVFLVGFLFLSSGLFSKTKPNNSFYVARILSEKARLNTTFNEDERDALSLQFASNHAQDIATVLMDPEFNTEENKKAVEKLNASFENEMNKVQSKINKNIESTSEDVVISSSDLIEENGTEIYINDNNEENISNNEVVPEVSSSSDLNVDALEEEINDSYKNLDNIENGQKMLDEIRTLFNEGNYSEVIEKLNDLKKIVDNK